ncbi:MAG TPA: hypothetical protein VF088_07915 [Pyrinomonadaceae bacterium]
MRHTVERKISSNITHVSLVIACLCVSAFSTFAADGASRVMIREDVSRTHRDELVARLRVITGWPNLNFDTSGALRLDVDQPSSGSKSARMLLSQAIEGTNLIVLEDASSRSDVAFCRVVRGRWTRGESSRPPAYVVLIDFTDFHRLSGDAEARAAFDVGWGMLHEIDHVVRGSEDASDAKTTGECEDHINQMRLELGLPVRVDYFFSPAYLKADANFNSKYVRLSFARKAKRYWLVWDATTVGGLLADNQRALVR